MKYSEMKMLILLELLAPEDGIDRYNIPDDTKEHMREMVKGGESMSNIVDLMPESDSKYKLLELAKRIDEEIEYEKEENRQTKQYLRNEQYRDKCSTILC